jgi:hypothetical protein
MLSTLKSLEKEKYISLRDFIVSNVVMSYGLLEITTYAFL